MLDSKVIKYFNVHQDTPKIKDRTKKSSVHFSDFRLKEAKNQIEMKPVDIKLIISYVNEFLNCIDIPKVLDPIVYDPLNIDYKQIKKDYNLLYEDDIVWMKFTSDGYLGVVALGADINFNIPKNSSCYNEKELRYCKYKRKNKIDWKYNTSGILIHQVNKNWDTSFVLLFPLANIAGRYKKRDIELALGNLLIDKGVPIIDFYSHNY